MGKRFASTGGMVVMARCLGCLINSNKMMPQRGTEQPLLTSNSKKRVGDAATERCRFSVLEGVSETTDGERAATGVSAKAATAVNLVAPTS